MKSKMFKKVMAASLATAMTVGSLAGCGSESAPAATTEPAAETKTEEAATTETATTEAAEETTEEATDDAWTPVTDENGNVYDLGGMEIIIRDWWSSGEVAEPKNDYEEARQEWRDWIQETYNFTIKEQAISDWGSAPQDFVEYVTTGGDDNNYVFVLRGDPATTSAMASGLMKDLSTIPTLDLTQPKHTKNRIHELYSYKGKPMCMYAGDPETRGGVYFNKRLLKEAGIDPESLYDLQENMEWTWDKWEEMMEKVQSIDKDNDGTPDVYGMTLNNGNLVSYLVFSNGGEFVGQENGQYVNGLYKPETVEALEEVVKLFQLYDYPGEPDHAWDAYKEYFKAGKAAFMPDDSYCMTPGNFLEDMEDDFGFVCIPMGPRMNDYTNNTSNNPHAIPACYDDERAAKIAFAFDQYTHDIPGYENYEGWKSNYYNGARDTKSVDLTLVRMMNNGMVTYHELIPSLQLGSDLAWGINKDCVVSEKVDSVIPMWDEFIKTANE